MLAHHTYALLLTNLALLTTALHPSVASGQDLAANDSVDSPNDSVHTKATPDQSAPPAIDRKADETETTEGLAPDARGTAPAHASSPNEIAQPHETASDDDVSLEHATPDPTPPVPEPLQREQSAPQLDVIEQAGVGGPTAFGSAGVLEVGGSGSIIASSGYIMAKFAPSAGLFIYDGIQLSYAHEIYGGSGVHDDGVASLGVLDVSLHVPFGDRALGYVGVGPGVHYNGEEFGAGGKARAGVEILIGRSALIRVGPFYALMTNTFVDLRGSLTPQRWQTGLDVAYAALF